MLQDDSILYLLTCLQSNTYSGPLTTWRICTLVEPKISNLFCSAQRNLILQTYRPLYVELAEYLPSGAKEKMCLSSILGCNTMTERASQRDKKSIRTPTECSLDICNPSSVQQSFLHSPFSCYSIWDYGKQSWRNIWNLFPLIHLFAQKKVLDPLPVSVISTLEKKSLALLGTCIGSPAHGRLGSVLCSHNHLMRRAQQSSGRLQIPNPPNCKGRHTLPHGTC